MIKLFRPVGYICGMLTLATAALMLIPTVYAVLHEPDELHSFVMSSGVTALIGMSLMLLCRSADLSLNSRQLYLLTSCSWILLSLVCAIPFMLSTHALSLADAFFESVSGMTTTGSTVIVGLSSMPRSFLLWRSELNWIGGMGVIGMAVSILPFLSVGGMRLFKTESSDWSEKSLPRFQSLARTLLAIYLVMSLLCTVCYWLAGMTLFDAVNHMMATVSTGGYATDDTSMGRFSPLILWISVVFMLLSALPFTVFVRMVAQRSLRSLSDEQVKGFLLIVTVLVALLSLYLIGHDILPPFEAVTHAAFNIVSIITTTGFASTDYTLWGEFSIGLFFVITFIGGCSGSTSGGMKVFRYQLSYLFLQTQLRKLVHPRGVFAIRYNGRVVQDDIMASAVAFSFMYFVTLAFVTLLLTLLGVDFLTSFTGASTALANVGPGLGSIIGPAGNFMPLPDSAKWVLSFAMILGRLELLTVIVLFSRAFWKG